MKDSKKDIHGSAITGDNFDPFADDYDVLLEKSLTLAGGDRIQYAKYKTDFISQCIKELPYATILDYGCGDGTSLSLLRSNNAASRLHGIDISEASLTIARGKCIQECTFHSFNGLEIPYSDKYFNVVFAANVFHHVPFSNHGHVLQEILRVMKEGAYLFIFEHNPYNPVTKKIFKDCIFDRDATMLSPHYLNRQLLSFGFKKVQLSYHLFFPRHTIFTPLWKLESSLSWLPVGGQYCAWYSKS